MNNINKLVFFFLLIFLINFSNTFASEVEILSDIPGTGPTIKNHYKVSVHYKGFLEDGTEFDSSFKRNQPFVFQIGLRQVIPGWEIGLINMKVGGKRKIKIPSELAYGENGAGEFIPPNANLIFEVEIISIQPPGYKILIAKELNKIDKKDFIIIDIRTKKEWRETGVIKGSNKITAFDITGKFEPSFLNSYQAITNSTNKVVFISNTGDISAILANGFIEHLKYKNIYSLKGGIQEWISLKKPITK